MIENKAQQLPTKRLARQPLVRDDPSEFEGLYRLQFQPGAALTDELFSALSAANPDLRLERTSHQELEVIAPACGNGSNRNFTLIVQLGMWVEGMGRGLGVGFDSSGGFLLSNDAIRSPDASWLAQSRWDALSPEQKLQYLPLCPDFVVELRSPSDSLAKLRRKMKEYITEGAKLGWLIDPLTATVEIYRPGKRVEKLTRPSEISADPELPGFHLNLKGILTD